MQSQRGAYGLDETFSLLIPNVKGGATIKFRWQGRPRLLGIDQTKKADLPIPIPTGKTIHGTVPTIFRRPAHDKRSCLRGTFILMLAILALFVVDGSMKWALFAASVLAILLSWGHNFSPLTDFFIDYLPGYNKFRAVASILVIVEFTIPLLAAMCVRKIIDTPDFIAKYKWTLITVMGCGAAVCLLGWISPSIFGSPFSAREVEQLTQMGVFTAPEYANLWNAVRETRLSLVSADSIRSLIFIAIGCGLMFLWFKKVFTNKALFVCCLTAATLIDLYPADKRYVDSESFVTPAPMETAFKMTDADRAILADKSNYRVMDVAGFNDARSSYFHKTIGGYHAAKLTRYNDLITHQISKGNPGVLNMLNAKYILNGDQYEVNPGALGNAWFVDGIAYVGTPTEEMTALDSLDTGTRAIADSKFKSTLGDATPKNPGDTIYETPYAPNKLTYKSRSSKENLAIFSEIFFPWGWTATIDGKEVPIGRADYVLRALRIPSGEHEIIFSFDPKSLKVTNAIAITSVVIIYISCLVAFLLWCIHMAHIRKEPESQQE